MSEFIPVYYGGAIFDWAWVDDVDADRVSRYRWVRAGIHATISSRLDPAAPARSNVNMHRFVLDLEPGDGQVHHVNEDGFDNRRENLLHVADKLAHGRLPHPRRDAAVLHRLHEFPPSERRLALRRTAAA